MIAKGKLRDRLRRRSRRLSLAMLLLGSCSAALAQDELREESIATQQAQAELQRRIDAADEASREALSELRAAEREASRLRSYNAELAPLVERQVQTITQREQALETLAETRETLPVLMRDLVNRLRRLIEADLPFLRDERLARVKNLEDLLVDGEMGSAEKLDRLLAAWRTELDYGRELDAWRGALVGAQEREVEYLRLGRLGLYYVTPNGSSGGVWKVEAAGWEPLNDAQLAEVRKGLSIVREQRAPELLDLPVSVNVLPGQDREEAS